jgi:indole-3-glycerol phosphate synthase
MDKLLEILEHKKIEIEKRRHETPVKVLTGKVLYNRIPVSLSKSLRQNGAFGIIAEIKRASPSAGIIRNSLDVQEQVREYERNGAAAISILTDEKFFQGSLNDLLIARSATGLPLLRKDFIIDEYQIHESKAYGADAVLLIADILSAADLFALFRTARSLGMETLIEIYGEDAVGKINFREMKLIGINNRDLRSLNIDLTHTRDIIELLPGDSDDTTVISESGVSAPEDVVKLKGFGARGVLIGEYLMRSENPGEQLRQLQKAAEKIH